MDTHLALKECVRSLIGTLHRLIRELWMQFRTFRHALRFYRRVLLSRQLTRRGVKKTKGRGQHSSTSLGQKGEEAAARFLKRHGFQVVRRSSRDRLGEIDLVAVERRTVVFVEVKTRSSGHADHPSEAVDLDKQNRLLRAASYFIKKHHLTEQRTRFDVISVFWPKETKQPRIEHERDAFS